MTGSAGRTPAVRAYPAWRPVVKGKLRQGGILVIDAYTRRILKRHGLTQGKESYEELRGLFEKSLPLDAQLFNEYHALIVHTGKHHCQARAAICSNCALREFLPAPREAST